MLHNTLHMVGGMSMKTLTDLTGASTAEAERIATEAVLHVLETPEGKAIVNAIASGHLTEKDGAKKISDLAMREIARDELKNVPRA